MGSLNLRSQNLDGISGNIYAPGDWVSTYSNVAQNNSNTFIFGTLGDANITSRQDSTDTQTGFHRLFTLKVEGSYKSYTVSSSYGYVTLTNVQNGQTIKFQLSQPEAGANDSGVDVQFLDGGLAFTSYVDANSGAWSAYVTKGGTSNMWGTGSVALPATNVQTALSLATLGSTTVNPADTLAPIYAPSSGSVASTWSSTTGLGMINLDTALALATGKTVTPASPLTSASDTTTLNWGINAANFQSAWKAGYTGAGITIAVIDSGLDLSNTALKTNYLASKSSAFSSVQDFNGHGTFVASQIIAQNTGTAANPSPVTGGAYGASLLALNDGTYVNGSYQGIQGSIAAGITYAVNNGANVINISLGTSVDNELLTALQYASDNGVIVVVASANSGYTSPAYPAAAAQTLGNVIAVGATQYTASGSDIVQAGFSNQAGSSAAYNYVDAPGANVLGYQIGGGVKADSGTSYAAPEVAAEAAVLEQAIKQSNPALDQTQLAAAVVHAITVGLVGVSPNVITNDATNAYSPYTFTLSASVTSYIAANPVMNTFNGSYSDGEVGGGNTFKIDDIITGKGTINTLNISYYTEGGATSFTADNDSIWSHVSGIQNLSIATDGTGAQTLTSGAKFNAAFATAGVYLTSTAVDGAINVYMDGSHGGTLFTGTETINANTTGQGAQTINAGSGPATVIASDRGGAQTIAGANLIGVSITNKGGGGAQTITSTGAGPVTISASDGSGAQTITSTGAGPVTISASDGSGAQTITSTGAGPVTISASDGSGAQMITSTGAGSVTITAFDDSGAQTITSTGAGSATITASDLSGAQTITTGAGNDILNVTLSAGATNTIATGAGNDTINLSYTATAGSASTNTITGGLGADTINLGTQTTGTVDKLIYAALSGTNDTGSAITANGALSGVDVISGARTGDVINLGAAAGTLTNALDGGFTNPVVAGGLSAQIVLGNYTGGTNGTFTASATGNSSLVQWADATVGHGTAAVVLIGYADTAATVISGAGLITLA
ncbi:S8 family serine peptidase [Candidatus Methylospira mobilis]|uniref:S8 family serine peptidase n=1 Tax=Candidatus Methylospira mobilis TaxID=1808979 RepID=A0A5Q0BJB8_9GAMM|nr:S8 family serine peptidase [Candidatus Methylospira mobilis]QFY42257.1 S8 family serine peptidase [Candidatus Methylospira mobilis]